MEYGRSLFSQSAPDAKVFLSDVYKRSTRAKKLQADDVQGGKSMIEMLGVLAVIGVLSVGGIAGYSKAMIKFKINKWRDDVVTTIANLNTFYINRKKYSDIDDIDLTDFFEELKIVPENMLDKQNRDVFGSRLVILSHIAGSGRYNWTSHLRLDFYMQPSIGAVEECKAMFDIVPQYEGTKAVTLNESSTGKMGGDLSICGKAAETDYAKYENCVSYNFTVIAQKCAICAKKNCDMYLVITNGI